MFINRKEELRLLKEKFKENNVYLFDLKDLEKIF